MKYLKFMVFLGLILLIIGVKVAAEELPIWRLGLEYATEKKPHAITDQSACKQDTVRIRVSGTVFEKSGCVTVGAHASLVNYPSDNGYGRYAVRFMNQTEFYPIDGRGDPYNGLIYVPATNLLIADNSYYPKFGDEARLEVYGNLDKVLVFYEQEGVYRINSADKHQLLTYVENGQKKHSYDITYAISPNGQFLMATGNDKYVAWVNLLTYEEKAISVHLAGPNDGNQLQRMRAVSNDGLYGFIDRENVVYNSRLPLGCGSSITDFMREFPSNGNKMCYAGSIAEPINKSVNYTYEGENYQFLDENNTFAFTAVSRVNDKIQYEDLFVHAPGYVKNTLFSYVALGDSYASGQGDVDKIGVNHYISGTNAPDGCHISDRSYPYLLRQKLSLVDDNSRSVACSGAKLRDDLNSNLSTYMGQNNQLISWSSINREKAQKNAINAFQPGVVPQVEFVHVYQPGFVTIMGGGNDIGFADILRYCAGELGTCGYAKKNSELASLLAGAISQQRGEMVDFIRKIKLISPKTVVFVIGYPKFISNSITVSCRLGLSIGILNEKEAASINNGVSSLNAELRAAAGEVGAYYIDTENVLNGGKLCDANPMYMTGLADIPGGTLNSSDLDKYQAFHPNSKGHERIFRAIIEQYPSIGSMQENPVAAGGQRSSSEAVRVKNISFTPRIIHDSILSITVPSGYLKPNSKVNITMYSDKVELGRINTRVDGSITATVKMPKSIDRGEHVTVLEGIDGSGKSLKLYTFTNVAQDSKFCHGTEKSLNSKCHHHWESND